MTVTMQNAINDAARSNDRTLEIAARILSRTPAPVVEALEGDTMERALVRWCEETSEVGA